MKAKTFSTIIFCLVLVTVVAPLAAHAKLPKCYKEARAAERSCGQGGAKVCAKAQANLKRCLKGKKSKAAKQDVLTYSQALARFGHAPEAAFTTCATLYAPVCGVTESSIRVNAPDECMLSLVNIRISSVINGEC